MVRNKKIRLKDIAYALNLSVTCVSRSLRDCTDISEDTKKMVRAKALELGYHSKYNELKTKEKYVVALIIDSIKNPYFIKLGDILFSKFSKEKCDFLIMIADPFSKVDDTLIKKCIYRNADVILSFNEFDEKSVDIAKINGIPLVMLGRIPEFDYVDGIYTDDIKGGYIAFNELLNKGSRRFLYLEESRSEASIRRFLGFQKANMEHEDEVELFEIADANKLDEVTKAILDKKIDGVFAYNDLFVLNLMNELKNRNINLQDKFNVIGYDNDIDLLKEVYKNMSSIEFDYNLIGDDVMKIIETKVVKKDKSKRFLFKIDVSIAK